MALDPQQVMAAVSRTEYISLFLTLACGKRTHPSCEITEVGRWNLAALGPTVSLETEHTTPNGGAIGYLALPSDLPL